jgi:hypothetical protein
LNWAVESRPSTIAVDRMGKIQGSYVCLRSNIVVEDKDVSASDEDGISEDSDTGYELIRITVPNASESPEVGPLNADAPKTGRLPDLLGEIWSFYGRKTVFTLLMDDWISKDPNLAGMLITLDPSLVEVFPNNRVCGSDGQPRAFTMKILPACLQQLQALSTSKPGPKTHFRQATVNGIALDLRSLVSRMIYETAIENLADACRIWLADLKNERKATAVRKVHILLSRTIGVRGLELAEYDPLLKREIMEALAGEGGMWELRESERGIAR